MGWLHDFLAPLDYKPPTIIKNSGLGPAEIEMYRRHFEDPVPKYRESSPRKKNTKRIIGMSFNSYVGQFKAKNILSTYIKKYQGKALPHIIIHGSAGCGKTTLARIIACEHKVPFVEVISKTITKVDELVKLIKSANGGIVFIDELHGLHRNKAEILYSIMEDFKYNGAPIKPFTLIGATTEYGELLKSRRPFVDRFKINLELEPYTIATLEFLLREYASKKYPNDPIADSAFQEISKNARLTPRTAIRLLDSTVCFDGNYTQVLQNYNIVKDGYTVKDIRVLDYLAKNKACGVESIAAYINTPKQSYLYEVEPYLLQTGMLTRKGSGRMISQEGINFLKSLLVTP